MSLYIVVPDSDRLRLKPLTRLLMTMITQRLVETLNPKENKHRLLMLIDEFPRLSRMPFFTDALSYVAGYNIKVMLIMQSKGQLDSPEAYGKGNVIIESCRTRCVYTPQDPDTAQWISDALGPKTEVSSADHLYRSSTRAVARPRYGRRSGKLKTVARRGGSLQIAGGPTPSC